MVPLSDNRWVDNHCCPVKVYIQFREELGGSSFRWNDNPMGLNKEIPAFRNLSRITFYIIAFCCAGIFTHCDPDDGQDLPNSIK